MIFAGWVVSLLVFLGILLLTYAFFAENVLVYQSAAQEEFFLTRHQIFYFLLFVFLIVNGLFYALGRTLSFTRKGELSAKQVHLRSWLFGFASVVNVFFIFSLGYISLINSKTSYAPEDLAFMVYIAPVMLAGSMMWLLVVLFKK